MKIPRWVDWVLLVVSTALAVALAFMGDRVTDWLIAGSMFAIAATTVMRIIEDSEYETEGGEE